MNSTWGGLTYVSISMYLADETKFSNEQKRNGLGRAVDTFATEWNVECCVEIMVYLLTPTVPLETMCVVTASVLKANVCILSLQITQMSARMRLKPISRTGHSMLTVSSLAPRTNSEKFRRTANAFGRSVSSPLPRLVTLETTGCILQSVDGVQGWSVGPSFVWA